MSRDSHLVTFWLESNEYAFDVDDVIEMTPVSLMTRLPGASDRVAGVTAWRGKTIPVIELGSILKLTDRSPDVKKKLLVLGRPGPFSVLIDRPGRILQADRAGPVSMSSSPDESREVMELYRTDLGLLRVLDPVRLIGSGQDLLARSPQASRTEIL